MTAFLKAQCEKIAIENPTPASVFNLPKCTQVIQPYEFGHPYSKRTCLWLKGLPHLTPTEIVTDHVPFVSSGFYTKKRMIQNIRVQAEKAAQQKQEVRLFRGLPGQWRNNGENVLTISILNDIIDMRATV